MKKKMKDCSTYKNSNKTYNEEPCKTCCTTIRNTIMFSAESFGAQLEKSRKRMESKGMSREICDHCIYRDNTGMPCTYCKPEEGYPKFEGVMIKVVEDA